MWIFTTHGLLSIVEHPTEKDTLVVRARAAEHITATFPKTVPTYTPLRDYRYRILLRKQDVATVISKLIKEIDYGNFKDAADKDLKVVYSRIWAEGLSLEKWEERVSYGRQTGISSVDLDTGQSTWARDEG